MIEGGASINRIGTDGQGVDDAGERNVIAGSDNDGIDIVGTGTDATSSWPATSSGPTLTGTIPLGVSTMTSIARSARPVTTIGVNPDGGAAERRGQRHLGRGHDGVMVDIGTDNNVVAGT